jgi:ankyrin repeat protein
MKTINLLSLVLVSMLIITGCKKQEPRPATQGTAETVRKPTDTIEPAQPVESLHEAAAAGDIQQIKSLISAGADVNAKDDKGSTPLHYAVILANKDVIELLIAGGADVNVKDDQGHTALWWAKQQENAELTDLLLKHGAKE